MNPEDLANYSKTYLNKIAKNLNIKGYSCKNVDIKNLIIRERGVEEEKIKIYIVNHPYRGSPSVITGNKYEDTIYNICQNLYVKDTDEKFNTQNKPDLGGSTNNKDIICNFEEKDINIEIKNSPNPECIQFSLHKVNQKWVSKNKNNIIDNLLENVKLFNDNIPPFLTQNITSEVWDLIKNNYPEYKKEIAGHDLSELLKHKNIHYIQVHKRGLYYIDTDICNFNVPKFEPTKCILRVRVKKHVTTNSTGFCSLSIMLSIIVSINNEKHSKYSLDDATKIPDNLVFRSPM
jgi:hypothetical protein